MVGNIFPTTDEEKLFCRRIEDMIARCEKQYTAQFSFFLDARQTMLARQTLARVGCDSFGFWGGYEDAERVMLGIFPPYAEAEDYPLTQLCAEYRTEDILTHRDFLGAILSLGMSREVIGDILTGEGRTVVFATHVAAELILMELEQVGRVGVKLSRNSTHPLPQSGRVEELSGTLSSLRLDCVVAFLTRLSREKATGLIKSGVVNLQHSPCEKIDRQVEVGDRITVRGYGKFVMKELLGYSKKGRIRVVVHKSIG